ncbi:hypothetical protein [Candidatus Nitrosocosmicus sp. T]
MPKRLYSIQKDLGMGESRKLIASSALLSINLFFYLLSLVSLFQPTVYLFIDRITYPTNFVDKYFINGLFDSLIIILCTILWFQFSIANNKKYFIMAAFGISFLLSLYFNTEFATKILASISFPTVLLFIIMNKILNKQAISFNLTLSVNYISVFGISIAIVSAFVIISHILFPELPLPSLNYLYYFFIILSIFSPLYLVLISFNYPLVLTFRILKKKWKKSSTKRKENVTSKEKYVKRRTRIFHLLVIIFLSIAVSMIPHLSTVNEDNIVIGSDTKYYIRFLETMADSSGYGEVLYKAFVIVVTGDRPLSLLFFYWLSNIFYQGNFYFLLEDLPILLGPLLVMSIYFLTLSITRNHFTSLFASLITIPSHILIGIYAGLYANWFALIWGYMAILFLFKLLDEPRKINLLIFSILLIILLFSHAQTWTIFMYTIGLFIAILIFKNKRENKKIVLSTVFSILPSLLIDLARMLFLNSSGVKQELSFALEREVGIHGVYVIWNNLIDTAHLYLAGQIANPIILLLVIYWLYTTKIKVNYAIFLIIFFSLFTLPLLFADATIQARFFYEIPFQIPAAIALTVLKQRAGSYLTFAICLWLTVMSLYMAENFVLVVPDRFLS